MDTKQIAQQIVKELSASMEALQPAQLETLETHIKKAGKIYVAGAGRSLLMIRGLAMRLMHMGYKAYVVGETVTPAAQKGDLLIIGSGSGETGALKIMAQKAKDVGASLALITIRPDSTIGNLADCVVQVSAVSTKVDTGTAAKSIQLGGNLFEQSLLLLCDALVVHLLGGQDLEEANRALMQKHANLE